MGRERTLPLPASRLLTLAEAAEYCRLSRPVFGRLCRVQPLLLDGKIERFDRYDLDLWIDGLKNGDALSDDDILARLG